MKFSSLIKSTVISLAFASTFASAQNYELVSQGATTTASTTESYLYEASNLTDGNDATRWASTFSNNQEVVVDLGEATDIDKIVLKWEAAYANYYKIQFSNDGITFYSPSYTNAGATGGTDEIVQDFGSYRFVKLVLVERATQYGFSLFEIEVYSEVEPGDHVSVNSLQLKSYSTYGSKPKPDCTHEKIGTMVVEHTGHYEYNYTAYICLAYGHPGLSENLLGWVPVASGMDLLD